MVRFGDPLEEARARISEEEYDDAVAAGRAMTPDQAVAFALGPTPATAASGD